jgi:hypothetical protein
MFSYKKKQNGAVRSLEGKKVTEKHGNTKWTHATVVQYNSRSRILYSQCQIFPVQANWKCGYRLPQKSFVPYSLPVTYVPYHSNNLVACTNNQYRSNKIQAVHTCMKFDRIIESTPFATVQNRNGFMPSLEKRQHSIFSSCNAKGEKGTASKFQISQHRNVNYRNHPSIPGTESN